MPTAKKKYIFLSGKHRDGKKVYEKGDIIELSPSGARALVNKVRPLDKPVKATEEDKKEPEKDANKTDSKDTKK